MQNFDAIFRNSSLTSMMSDVTSSWTLSFIALSITMNYIHSIYINEYMYKNQNVDILPMVCKFMFNNPKRRSLSLFEGGAFMNRRNEI